MKPITRVSCLALISGPLMQPSSSGPPSFMMFAIAAMPSHDPVVDAALDEDPRAAHAALTGVHEDAHRRLEDGLVQVGVVEDQHRRLATEFEHDLLEVACRGPHDLLADLGRSGEGDLLDVGMRGDRGTRGVAVTGQQVDHAVGDTGLGDQPVEQQRRKWGLLSGFDDACCNPPRAPARSWRTR